MLKVLPDEELFRPSYIEARPSPIAGEGLFTSKACRAGEAILILAGEVIDGEECLRRENEEGNCYIYFLDEDRFIDPGLTGLGRFLNHSCEPNSIPETRDADTLYLVALRDIAEGEEITIDYDYNEIYDLCREDNPHCRQEDCPLRDRWVEHSEEEEDDEE